MAVEIGRSAISKLLQVTPRKFFQHVFGQEHAYSADGALPYLGNLPNTCDLDDLYFALGSAGTRLGVVDGYASPSSGTSLVRGDGRVRLDEVHTAYRSGKTLLLTHLQNSHLGIARIARSIECELLDTGIILRKEVGANLFLTPPNSRGFEPHYDGHDVLILHLAGEKTWKVFDQLLEVPAGMEGGRLTSDQIGENCSVFHLSPGSVLYLPRGRPHAAYTTSQKSLHLTMSMVPSTLTDVILEDLKDNADAYKTFANEPRPASIEIDAARVKVLRDKLLRQWLDSLNAIPETAPWASAGTALVKVRLADGIIAELEKDQCGDTFDVHMPGASVTLGKHALEVVRLLLAGRIASTSEISLGGRSVESKTRFFQQLVDIGFAAPVIANKD